MSVSIDDLTLRQLRELQAIGRPPEGKSHGLCIVIADRGHVWVGDCETDAEWCHVRNARVVRRWGTTTGLNQLAIEGPLPETILGTPASLSVNRRAVLALIPVKDATQWAAS